MIDAAHRGAAGVGVVTGATDEFERGDGDGIDGP